MPLAKVVGVSGIYEDFLKRDEPSQKSFFEDQIKVANLAKDKELDQLLEREMFAIIVVSGCELDNGKINNMVSLEKIDGKFQVYEVKNRRNGRIQ